MNNRQQKLMIMDMTQSGFTHNYPFEPDYGFDLDALLTVPSGQAPEDLALFWQAKYQDALKVKTHLNLQDSGNVINNWRIFDCYFDSTQEMRIGGWLLLPENQPVENAVVMIHGYGGIEQPDTSWNLHNTALLFLCARGFGRSAKAPISNEPRWHVLHNIQDKQQYILGGCVQDIWCSISALLTLFPQLNNRIGIAGSSFGGGIGMFATAFDPRISRAHFHVPTFGNLALRMRLPTWGSTESLQKFAENHPGIIHKTLPYFDASCASGFISQPTHWALALFDPYVAPPGQFSIYNAAGGEKQLYLQDAGHFAYRNGPKQRRELRKQLEVYFAQLGKGNASRIS